MTYYDILGVPNNATFEQIKKAYREQIRFFHPDVFQGSEDVARLKTQQLNEAYEVLSDPTKRADYDSHLRWQQASNTSQPEQEQSQAQQEEAPDSQQDDTDPQNPDTEPPHTSTESKNEDPDESFEKAQRRKIVLKKIFNIAKVTAVIVLVVLWIGRLEDKEQAEEDARIEQAWNDGYNSGYADGEDVLESNEDDVDAFESDSEITAYSNGFGYYYALPNTFTGVDEPGLFEETSGYMHILEEVGNENGDLILIDTWDSCGEEIDREGANIEYLLCEYSVTEILEALGISTNYSAVKIATLADEIYILSYSNDSDTEYFDSNSTSFRAITIKDGIVYICAYISMDGKERNTFNFFALLEYAEYPENVDEYY